MIKTYQHVKAAKRGADQSPWIQSLRWEYERQELHRWDNAKVFKTARLFHCTVPELCAVAGEFDPRTIVALLKSQRWPMTMTIQWNKMLRARTGMRTPDSQDMAAAKHLDWESPEEPALEIAGEPFQ